MNQASPAGEPVPQPDKAQKPGGAWADRLNALKNVPPVLHFVWESGPAIVFWNIAIRIVVAFLPVGIGIICHFHRTFGGWSGPRWLSPLLPASFLAQLTTLTICLPTGTHTMSASR